MFCYQCQETAGNEACTKLGVCGKTDSTSNLMDVLIFLLKGIAIYVKRLEQFGISENKHGHFIAKALFLTVTNVNRNLWTSGDHQSQYRRSQSAGHPHQRP
jgi:hydroxylamine reductase